MEKVKKVKNVIMQNKRWTIVAMSIIIFIFLAENILKKEIFEFDNTIYRFLVEHRTNYLNIIFKFITQFGSAFCLTVISILCIIFIKNKKYKITIPLNLCVIGTLNFIMKNIFDRPRPNELRIIEESGFSFPSGHSMVSMAFYGYFIYIIYKNIQSKKLRNLLCGFLILLIILIGLSRVYLGVHYVSDVIAGICFSIAYLIIMITTGAYR